MRRERATREGPESRANIPVIDRLPSLLIEAVGLVDVLHRLGRGRECVVDEDEDGLLRRELDALPDDVDELAYGQILWDEVLLLVEVRNIATLGALADDLDSEHVRNSLFGSALQERCARRGGE